MSAQTSSSEPSVTDGEQSENIVNVLLNFEIKEVFVPQIP